MMDNDEQFVGLQLKRYRDAITPPRMLLRSLLQAIPTGEPMPVRRLPLFLKLAIPVGVMAIALLASLKTLPTAPSGHTEAFDEQAIATEEKSIAKTAQDIDVYFQEEANATEVDAALATLQQ